MTHLLKANFERERINLFITTNVSDYNIFTQAGSPTEPVEVVVFYGNGGRALGSSTSGYGMRTGTGWHANSIIKLKAVGTFHIYGQGGQNGVANGGNGAGGGDALLLEHNITIDNSTTGFIFGGGGGGGAGAEGTSNNGTIGCLDSGAGGNGGDGADNAAYTNGVAGSGYGGAGGRGGVHGGNGVSGSWGIDNCSLGDSRSAPGSGGAAGKAIELNGYSVTWIAGNNGTQVKGAQS